MNRGTDGRLLRPLRRVMGEAGFTLMELLISLVLISLITLLLFSALRLGGRSWESSDRHVEAVDEMRLVRGFLQRSLSELAPVIYRYEGESGLLFRGEAGAMEWSAPLSRHVGPGGLAVVRLWLQEEEGEQSLLLRRWLFHPDVLGGGSDYPAWEPLGERGSIVDFTRDDDQTLGVYGEHVLLTGVEQFELAYFGEIQPGDGADWHEEWSHKTRLPDLVRLRLRRAPEEWWPELVVRLPASAGVRR